MGRGDSGVDLGIVGRPSSSLQATEFEAADALQAIGEMSRVAKTLLEFKNKKKPGGSPGFFL